MTVLISLLLLVPTVFLIVGDFRNREVRLIWLLVFTAVTFGSSFLVHGPRDTLMNIMSNMLLLSYMGAGVMLWLYIRNRKTKGEKTSLRELFGTGDVVFMLALTPLFDIKGYLIFLIAAMVVSLVWWLAVHTIRRKSVTIPFIGTAGIVFSLGLIISAI